MENAARKGLRLISFDGGGIRSLSQPRIMETLMHRLEYKTNPEDSDQEILACERFEMMGGSDTGGLIALMFGKLRMSAKEVVKEFRKICYEVYMGQLSPATRTQNLKACIEDLLRRRGLPIDLKLGKDKRVIEQGCPCFVLATPKASMNNKIKLRTYRSRKEPSLDITLVDAILATCATQPTFLPVSLGPELAEQDLVGGGMGMANPCRELIVEAQDKFDRTAEISAIISLGSGHLGTLISPAKGGKDEWVDVLRNMMESCERIAQEMKTQIGHFDVYFRFSVEQGLQQLYGAKVEDVPWLNTQTATYLQDAEVSRQLDVCVERLISPQNVIMLEELGLSRPPKADLQFIQSMTQNLLVSTHDEKQLLEELRPKDMKGVLPVEECLDETREDIIQIIIDWITDLEAPNILWLKAHPGAGKTAVALTLVKRLRQLGRLGSSFFFQRAKAADLTPHTLWCKAAFDLAYKDPAIRTTLVTRLKADRDVANTNNLIDLFRHLIEEPLLGAESTSTGRSLVLVVDALDECGGLDGPHSKNQEQLLRTIQQWSTLARGFKLIVTSRGEDEIERVLHPISHVVEISTGSGIRDKSWDDIKQFLTLRFEKIARQYSSLQPDWPGTNIIEQLADQAGGLFIWARTVVEFIARGSAEQQLSRILQQSSSMGNMAALYTQIISISFPEETNDIIEAFRSTLGAVIFAKTPLSLTSLSNLLLIEQSRVEHICTKLKSVIHVGNTIQITHQSFVDFLLDPRACPSAFYIRPEDEEQRLAIACLQAMRHNLRFNICGLESSCLLNSEVDDMKSRIDQNISNYVLYSCQYWIEHLVANKYSPEVLEYLRYFTENQFLFWLEVLSVTSQMNSASNMLSLLKDWMKKHNQDESMVTDMERFTTTFTSIIAQSAPHIYLSALPFAPQHSAVFKCYNDRYPGLIRIERGGLEKWPRFECIMYGHRGMVSSIAISQDGTRIVSGSSDETVRVWDAATGQPLGAPFEGHTDWVTSVAFSPDGTCIASGSGDKTVQVWDVATGLRMRPPFGGHTDWVTSVAFSSDGTRIVSGSRDETVRVWDAATGQSLGAPFEGHTEGVTSIAYSSDGTRIVSSSGDEIVRVWDAATGQRLGASFKGHTQMVTSVAFSSDGTRIVSGSDDKTVQVWDASTGQRLGVRFKGHTQPVTSVAFSPDGTLVVSGSVDKTMQVWEAATGQPLGAPFEGHTDWITSVAFSPDGTRIISGSYDETVRVWDAATSQRLEAPFDGHNRRVTTVAFSPDGARVVSGSDDKTVRVWDAVTGQRLGAQLKGHTQPVTMVAFSPDGARIVSGSEDKTVRVWDAATGRSLGAPFEGHTDWITSVAFSPDGFRIVSGSDDGTVRVWDAATGQQLRAPFEGHIHWITSVAFSPDGTRIVSGSRDETVRLWNVANGQPLGPPFEGHTQAVTSVAFSPDGALIVSGSEDETVRLWNAATGQSLGAPFEGHTDCVTSVAFSPDGTLIISSSEDKTVRVWDAMTGQPLDAPFEGQTHVIRSIIFFLDRTRVVSFGSDDKTIQMWETVRHKTKNSLSLKSSFKIVEGWVLNSNSERLFWVLPSLQAGLLLPGRGVILGNFITRVNMERFQYRQFWTQCRKRAPSIA